MTVFEDVRVARFDKICLVGLLITCLVSRSDREVAEVVVVVTALDHPVTATAVTAVIVTVTVNATVTAEADTTVNADAVPRPATTASATVIAAMIARTATDPVTDPGSGLCAVRSVINYINSTAYASACRFMSNIPQMDGMLSLSNQTFFSCSLELWRMTSPDTDNRRTRENLTLESISPILPCKPIKASSSRSRLAALQQQSRGVVIRCSSVRLLIETIFDPNWPVSVCFCYPLHIRPRQQPCPKAKKASFAYMFASRYASAPGREVTEFFVSMMDNWWLRHHTAVHL